MSEYTLQLGPLRFITVLDGIAEPLGGELEAVGAMLAESDPQPRPWNISLPVRGAASFADGERLRRQVRAFFSNHEVLQQPQWFQWDVDRELDGWLRVGGGDLEPAEGGVTFADFTLRLRSCYRVGSPRTLREAVQVAAFDRRLPTTPRDTKRLLYSTQFAAKPAVVQVALPVGAFDVTTFGSVPTLTAVDSSDGQMALVDGPVDGQAFSFERDTRWIGFGDVRASNQPTEGADPSTWEAVYGPDAPINLPALSNGRCRVRALTPTTVSGQRLWPWVYDVWSAGSWNEIARWATPGIDRCWLVSWMPERCVIAGAGTSGSFRSVTYVTLERGRQGPRIETYSTGPPPAVDGVAIRPLLRLASFRDQTGAVMTHGRTFGPFGYLLVAGLSMNFATVQVLTYAACPSLVSRMLSPTGVDGDGAVLTSTGAYTSVMIGGIGSGSQAPALVDASAQSAVHLAEALPAPTLVART